METKLNLKIKLDTNNKEISVENSPNLGDLFKGLEKLLPKDSPFGYWKDYRINTNSIISWHPYYVYYGNYPNWWSQPQIMYNSGTILTNNCDLTVQNQGNFAVVTNTCNSNIETMELPKEENIYYIEM